MILHVLSSAWNRGPGSNISVDPDNIVIIILAGPCPMGSIYWMKVQPGLQLPSGPPAVHSALQTVYNSDAAHGAIMSSTDAHTVELAYYCCRNSWQHKASDQ